MYSGKYDGVHMYSELGREAYMKSVLNILLSSFEISSTVPRNILQSNDDDHTRCPQALYRAGQKYHQDNWQRVARKEKQFGNRAQSIGQQTSFNPTWHGTYSSVAAVPVHNRFSILGN